MELTTGEAEAGTLAVVLTHNVVTRFTQITPFHRLVLATASSQTNHTAGAGTAESSKPLSLQQLLIERLPTG